MLEGTSVGNGQKAELKTLKLSQEGAIMKLAEKYDIEQTGTIPMKTNVKLIKEGTPLDIDTFPCNELIGSMLYLSTSTRPDISYAIGVLSRYVSCPTTDHWNAAIYLLKYLKSTSSVGITYGNQPGIKIFCDADYAGEVDTRRSTTGYVIILNGGAVSWNSRLQPTVAVSTCEAEFMAAAAVTKEVLWMRKILQEVMPSIKAKLVFSDNQGTINLLKHPVADARSKHIDTIYKFVRERINRNEIEFEYIQTSEMIADCFTKPLSRPRLTGCKNGMGVSI